ncbi:unnamed protein product [Lathyrus oleraceus]|uniref:uncharacterized protein LOC127075476 n=1 Tax=Pisum sativum TaxID=3888 RepID=UPI001FC5F2C9|nr:uncharacterized protein LOC127075476 [Pisum sativum]
MKLKTQASQSDLSFSFPSTPNQEDSDFEFGSLTPNSPSCTTSPADQLFFNGRLQPHSFPLNHVTTTSRTASIGSKDSLLSSRSNSTNSSCSSARTSSSDTSERKLFHNRVNLSSRSVARPVQQSYGCSQRWQYIMPVPAGLNRDASKRRKQKRAKTEKKKNMKKRASLQFVRRVFRWFFIACRQCHAMEPPSKARNKGIKTQ